MSVIGLAAYQLRTARVVSPGLHGFGRSTELSSLPRVQLGDPGSCPVHGTLLIMVFDNSASLSGPAGADPISNRYAEASHAIRTISKRCTCGNELVAVLHFDSPTAADVVPTTLGRRGGQIVEKGLHAPPDGAGSSVLLPSLELAHRTAADNSDHDATLVVFSDFDLLDSNPAVSLSRLNEFPGDVHAVVLGRKIPDGLLHPRIKITHVAPGDLPGAVARALFDSLITSRAPSSPGPSGASVPA